MIIFGLRSSRSKPQELSGQTCLNCKQSSISCFSVFNYFHIYWLPIIPLRTTHYTHCGHCKQVLSQSELKKTGSLPIKFPNIRRPWIHYLAPVGIAALIIIALINGEIQPHVAPKSISEKQIIKQEAPLANREGMVNL